MLQDSADRRRRWVDPLLRARLTTLSWAFGALATAWILTGPFLGFAYLSPRGHLVLNTVTTCVALLAAYLAHGRFVRSHRLTDLLLAQCLLVLALSAALGDALGTPLEQQWGTTEIWLPVMLRAAGAGLLLAAAVVGPGRQTRPSSARWTALGPLLVLGVGVGASWLLGPVMPIAVDQDFLGDHVRPPLLTAHPALIVGHLVEAVCFLTASVLYTRRGLRNGEELVRWLGAACALGGFARVSYALSPSLYSDWLYTGDLLRTGFFLLLLVGSAREVSQWWSAHTEGAVEEDRRRVARELHDGVVQELTYIRGEAYAIPDESLRDQVLSAADRALDEARTAIHALGHLGAEPLADMLYRTARELGRRHGLTVEVEADHDVDVESHQQHTILRIVREAVTNAARHGRAGTVRIEVGQENGHRLVRVRDDGDGFDPREVSRTSPGYGMISMEERARSLPGVLEIDSSVGRGSEVRIRW